MSGAVAYPTVLVGLGRFGHEVVDRALLSLDADSPLLAPLRCEAGSAVAAGLHPLLEELLRAGRGGGERRDPRLDVLVFAAALQVGEADLLTVCEDAARLVAEGYGSIFPADRPPEQRAAAMHLVVQVPALSHPRTAVALSRLAAVEAWARGRPAYPLLSRIWLVAQQTTAGTLTSPELVATCASFGVALVGSGLRTEDDVARRMAHPAHGEGQLGFVSVASAEVPEARVREYAEARAAYDGLGALVARLEPPRVDVALAEGAVAALQPEKWLGPLVDGEPAQRCRREAASLANVPRELPPMDVRVGPFDSATTLRARYPLLFEAGDAARPSTRAGDVRREALMRALDAAEYEVAATVEHGLRGAFDQELGPTSGLVRLRHVEAGLEGLAARLKDAQAREASASDGADVAEPPTGSLAPAAGETLERAVEALPARRQALATAVALSAAVLLAAAATGLALSTPPSSPPTGAGPARLVLGAATPPATGAAVDWSEVWPWLGAGAAALVAALGGLVLAGYPARRRVRRELEARREALVAVAHQREGSGVGRQAEAQLRVRRRRGLRGALLAVEGAAERLWLVRRNVREARDRARQRLGALGLTPAPEARQDDLGPLVGAGGLLHVPLLPSAVLARQVATCREVAEERVWADRLLEGSWPAGGLFEGAPCGDDERIAELARRQVAPLARRSLFEDEEAALAIRDSLAEFGTRVGSVLAPPCQPLDAQGDPVAGTRPGEGFVLAPAAGREVMQDALRDMPFRLPVLWSPRPAARVIFVRTWEGLTVEDVARGARGPS